MPRPGAKRARGPSSRDRDASGALDTREAVADLGGGVAAVALGIALLGVPLVIDAGAQAAFDAPKRLLALSTIVLATLAHLIWPGSAQPKRPLATHPWLGALLALAVIAFAILSAAFSPRAASALDSSRALLLYSLLLPLGATSTFQGRRGPALLGAFLAGAFVNAMVSTLQAADLLRPYTVEALGGRQDTGAFLGNEGQLAIILALACVASFSLLLDQERGRVRIALAGMLVVCGAALVLNRSLTAFTATAVGTMSVVALRFKGRVLVAALLAGFAMVGALLLAPPARDRVSAAWSDVREGNWDELLTYRLGPWAAALEMIRNRPILGVGPGNFGAEFVPHRLSAEIRYGERFLNPTMTSNYSEAHSEYLQLAAEAGIPAALAALGAWGLLLWGVVRVAVAAGPHRREAVLLTGILMAGATAALTWFPLKQPALCVPLLLAAGRAWSLSAEGETS